MLVASGSWTAERAAWLGLGLVVGLRHHGIFEWGSVTYCKVCRLPIAYSGQAFSWVQLSGFFKMHSGESCEAPHFKPEDPSKILSDLLLQAGLRVPDLPR